MIIKYYSFINNRINEQSDWGKVKNLLGKLLSDINDDLKSNVSNLTNSLSLSDKPNRIKNIIINFFRQHEQNFINMINDVEKVEELNTLTTDNIKSIYGALISIFNSIGKISFEEIFKSSPLSIKRLFNEDSKNFDKNVKTFSINLISELSIKHGFDKNDVFNQLNDKKSLTDKEQKEQISEITGEEIQSEDDRNFDGLKNDIVNWFKQVIYKKINDFDFFK